MKEYFTCIGNGNPKQVQFFVYAIIFNYPAANLGLNVNDSVQTFPFNGCIHIYFMSFILLYVCSCFLSLQFIIGASQSDVFCCCRNKESVLINL